jgi:disulfide bond formation protein DsbB
MLGSLYFSEFAHLAPCILCWYQRICLYPLVLILGIGILRKDRLMWVYALPLSLIGTALALYHNLLQWGIISEKLAPCTFGVSCATKQVVALNFVTIPLLSLAAFVLISALMVIYRAAYNHD